MTIQFPRIELLRAETSLLQLDQVPEEILLQFQRKAKAIIPDLNKFVSQLPQEIAQLCSLDELRQNYVGMCDDKCIIYNFLNTNYNQDLKNSLVEFCLNAFKQLVQEHMRYALISSNIPRQYDTQYLIYENEHEVDRLSSFAVMNVLAYVQDVDNLYDSQLFLHQKNPQFEQLTRTPVSKPIKDTKNFIKDKDTQLHHMSDEPLIIQQNQNAQNLPSAMLNSKINQASNFGNLQLSTRPTQDVQQIQSSQKVDQHLDLSDSDDDISRTTDYHKLARIYNSKYNEYLQNPKLKIIDKTISHQYNRGSLLLNTQKMVEEITNERLNMSPKYARERQKQLRQIKIAQQLEQERIQREKEMEQAQQMAEKEDKENLIPQSAGELISIMDQMKASHTGTSDIQLQENKLNQYISNHPSSVTKLQQHAAMFEQMSNYKIQNDEEYIKQLKELNKQNTGINESKSAQLYDNTRLIYPLSESQVQMLISQIETKYTNEITLLKQAFNEQIQEIKVKTEEDINKYREEVNKLQILLEQTQIQLKIKEKQYQDVIEREQFQRSSIHSLIKSGNSEENTYIQSNLQVSNNNSQVSTLKKEIELMKTTNDELNIIINNQKTRITKLQKDLNESQIKNQQQLKNLSISQQLQQISQQDQNTEILLKYQKMKQIVQKQQQVIKQQQQQLEQQVLIINKQNEKMLGGNATNPQQSDTNIDNKLISSQNKHIQQLEQEIQQKDAEISDLQSQLHTSKSRESFLLKQTKSLQNSVLDGEQHKSQSENKDDIEREINEMTDAFLHQRGLGSLTEIKEKYIS